MNRPVFRFVALLLCFFLMFSLTACGKGSGDAAVSPAPAVSLYPELTAPPWKASFVPLQSDSLWSLRPVKYTEDGFYATAQVYLGQRELPAGQVPEYDGQTDLYGTVTVHERFP